MVFVFEVVVNVMVVIVSCIGFFGIVICGFFDNIGCLIMYVVIFVIFFVGCWVVGLVVVVFLVWGFVIVFVVLCGVLICIGIGVLIVGVGELIY